MTFYQHKWLLWLSVFTSWSLFAQVNTTASLAQQDAHKIKNMVTNYFENHAFEGTVLVAKSGKVIVEEVYGTADRLNKKPITAHQSFLIASLSKPITATLILKLVEQGKLELDDTLADYFPEFNNAWGKKITLDHLLSHRSGIPNHFTINGWFSTDFHQKTSDQAFIKIITELTPAFAPGDDYLYSNPGYFLLGKIVEKINHKSYAASAEEYIFSPLKMTYSSVAEAFKVPLKSVKGYQWKNDGGYREQVIKNMSLFGAGAAIFSNAADLYRFDQALYGEALLSLESKKRLFDPQHAYSWRVGKVPVSDELEVNIHTYDGQFDGYSAMMTRFIDDKHSIILLSNNGISYFLKEQLTFDIAAVLYQQEVPDRKNDASLMLINSIVSGAFKQAFNRLNTDAKLLAFNEASLSSLAFDLLWANMPENALQLFAFITEKYPNSTNASANLLQACSHRLASNAKKSMPVCN